MSVTQRTVSNEHQKILKIAQNKMNYYENAKLNTKWKIRKVIPEILFL